MLKLLNNKVVIFVISRYFSYVVQFVNSLIVAYVLGPYYLGIWGFLLLVLQYLSFGNFGIDIALNVSLSTGDLSDSKRQSKVAANALIATLATSLIFMLAGGVVLLSGVSLFPKYGFGPFMMPVLLISCLNYFNVLLLNICRTYSLFTPISIFQTLLQVLQLPVLFIYRDAELLWALLWVTIAAHCVSLVIFVMALPFKLSLRLDTSIVLGLYKRGISLLSYALTFYILLLSTRSMVGYFYPVETMGMFTFATNIATALIVGLTSLEFVLFPKMINRLSVETLTDQLLGTFRDVRYIYMATAFIVVLLGLICYPLILVFFAAYRDTLEVFTYLAVCQVILSSGFGYSTLIISRQKELYLVLHGIVALLLNLCLSLAAKWLVGIPYQYMALFLIFSFLYYDFRVIQKGRELLGLDNSIRNILSELLPARSRLSLLLIIPGVLTPYHLLFNTLALATFLALNAKNYKLVKQYIHTLFHKPAIVNIQQGG